MGRKRQRRNPAWKSGPFTVDVDWDGSDYRYVVRLDGEYIGPLFAKGYGSHDAALRKGLEFIEDCVDKDYIDRGYEPWREPNEEEIGGAWWWGPADDIEEAESVVRVAGDCVQEYTYTGWQGPKGDEWSFQEYCFNDAPCSVRLRAAVGVQTIREDGPDESHQMSSDEVPFETSFEEEAEKNPRRRRPKRRKPKPKPKPKPRANAASIMRRFMR